MNDVFLQLLWIFPVYSFLGWCLEVIYTSVNTGKLVNRGFLNGAVCPIYGAAAGIFVLLLTPVKYNFILLFFGSVIVASLLELITGFLLNKMFHMSWWDYSNEPFHIGGYICLKFSILWGVASVVLMRVIHPHVSEIVEMIQPTLLTVLLITFYAIFSIDVLITVLAVLKLNRDLSEIVHLSELIKKGSDKVAEGIGKIALQTADKIKADKTKMVELTDRITALHKNNGFIRLRLIKAFPQMKNLHNNTAFSHMKTKIAELAKTKDEKKD